MKTMKLKQYAITRSSLAHFDDGPIAKLQLPDEAEKYTIVLSFGKDRLAAGLPEH